MRTTIGVASFTGGLLLLASFAGCSDSETGLPVGDGGLGGAGGTAGAGGTGGMAGAGGAGGTAGAGGTGGIAGAGGTGGRPMDAPVLPDGFGDMSLPDVTVTDAPPPSPGKIDCGAMSCNVDKEICCTTPGPGGSIAEMCLPKGSPCPGAAKTCDGKEDCPSGRLCCLRVSFMGARVECTDEKTCSGSPGPMGGYPLCHTNMDCPADRPNCCAFSIGGATFPVCSMYKC